MIDFLMNYWWILIVCIACGAIGSKVVTHFFELSTEEQILSIKEWLVWAVSMAEKELGCGTGALKLRRVYDMFLTKFPHLAKIITFTQFSEMVDNALETFKRMLASNTAIQSLVEGDKNNG